MILNLLLIVGIMSTISCIGGGGGVTTDSAPQIMSTFATLMNQLPRGNKTATLPNDLVGGGVTVNSIELKATPRLSCESSSPAFPIDTDGDGISLLKEYTFNCNDFVGSGYTYNRVGSFKSIDLDDTTPGLKGGYRFEFNIPTWLAKDSTTGFSSGGSYRGSWVGSGTDTSSTYGSDYSGSYYSQFNLPELGGDVAIDYTFSHKFDVKYTHNSTTVGGSWSAGTMEGTGSYSFSGQFITEDGGKHQLKTGQAAMNWKTENVTFDSTCSKWYKTGRFYLTDTSGNVIRSEFGCTEVKVYFNDSEITGAFW